MACFHACEIQYFRCCAVVYNPLTGCLSGKGLCAIVTFGRVSKIRGHCWQLLTPLQEWKLTLREGNQMRVALTGGATGIGACVAAKLKQRGASIVAFDVNKPEHNVDDWIKTDLSDPASINSAVEEVEGSFNVLINNAGLPPRDGFTEKVLQVNFFGLRHFMESMLDRLEPGASIINTASRAGSMWRENIDQVKALMALKYQDELPEFIDKHNVDPVRAYNLSKEAVIALTFANTERLLRREFRINSVSPAAVSTDILDDFKAAFGARAATAIARAGRPGSPDEIAEVIVFLASPQSHWVKGQNIMIDGGMTAMATTDELELIDQNNSVR